MKTTFEHHAIGTEVWYVPRRKPVKTKIKRIRISLNEHQTHITYFVEKEKSVYGEAQVYGDVFLTKQEAEDSL